MSSSKGNELNKSKGGLNTSNRSARGGDDMAKTQV